MPKKNLALEKIESHEKLCRIMQKQTHQKISGIENDIKEIKNHMRYAMTALVMWYGWNDYSIYYLKNYSFFGRLGT
jgi:hypothetical protein